MEKSKLGAISSAATTASSKSRGRDRSERIRQLLERARSRDRGTPDDMGQCHSPIHSSVSTASLSRHRSDPSSPTSDSRAMVLFKEKKSESSHTQHLKYSRKNSGSHTIDGRSSSRSSLEGRSSSRSHSRSDCDLHSYQRYNRRSSSTSRNSIGKRESSRERGRDKEYLLSRGRSRRGSILNNAKDKDTSVTTATTTSSSYRYSSRGRQRPHR